MNISDLVHSNPIVGLSLPTSGQNPAATGTIRMPVSSNLLFLPIGSLGDGVEAESPVGVNQIHSELTWYINNSQNTPKSIMSTPDSSNVPSRTGSPHSKQRYSRTASIVLIGMRGGMFSITF